MLELDLRLTGFGITKRGDEYLSRTIDSFKDVMNSIVNKPLLVQHPMKEDGSKALLESDTAYNLIGHISEIFPYDGGDELRCKCIVNDPIFIDFYNSLTDEDKFLLLDTSPAVVSNSIDEIDYDGKKLSKEIVESFNHLSLLVDTPSYWGRYVDTPGVISMAQEVEAPSEVLEEEAKIDFIGSVESTSNVSDKKLSPIVDNDEEKIQLNINNNNNEVSMEEKIEKEIASEVANDVIPEEIKEQASELSQEEVAHVVEEVKEINEILDSEEEIKEEEKSEEKIDEEEIKEEVKEEEKIDECGSSDENKIDSEEEVKEEVKEESEKIDEDEEVIDEEFETEGDEEREELVKVVGNLCDSVEGFRKPAMSKRYTPEAYVRKALSLNKQFIDKKYHSLIDSIDASSLEFGKELLDSIKGSEVKEVKSHKNDYVQVAPNLFMKKFF